MIKTLRKNRFLLEELVKRDFKKKYKRTVLGMLWSLLSPLLMLLVMRLVFTQFFGRTTPNYTVFIFSGLVVFNFFSDATNAGMSSLVSNSGIYAKVNVPKYLFLFSSNASTFIGFLLTLLVYFIFVPLDGLAFSWRFLLLLYPILCLTIYNLGIGLILSALFIFFKDIKYLYNVLIRLLMYMSAIFYPIDTFSEAGQRLFMLNPLYIYIEYFRDIVIGGVVPSLLLHALGAVYALLAFALGCLMYKKYNYRFLYYA